MAKGRRHEVTFYTYPKFLFCWPLMLLGFVFWFLAGQSWANDEVFAWIWAGVMLVVLMTLFVVPVLFSFPVGVTQDDEKG